MSSINIPSGISAINAILCVLIIAGSVYVLRKLKPEIKAVMYGTIGMISVVLYHIMTTPPMYEVMFSEAAELMALLICVISLLGGYYLEVVGKGPKKAE